MRSLQSPHQGTAELQDLGLADWDASLPAGDEGLVDMSTGRGVRWVVGRGWDEEPT